MTETLPIRLLVGLGNPGAEYETTRHNAGFWLLDQWADDLKLNFTHDKSFFGMLAKGRTAGDAIYLLKPMTYMNRSGLSVATLAKFYKIAPEQILVVHDELDLLPGQCKMKQGGGHAGHNGLKSIQSSLGSPNFWRLRIGIGHPRTLGLSQEVADFVLHAPRRDEQTLIDEVLRRARVMLPHCLSGDFSKAMTQLGKTL